jgi:hypothetical protein
MPVRIGVRGGGPACQPWNKFATRAKSKVYHVPGGDHPSMIAHPEVTVAAIEDAAKTVAP